MAATNWLLSDFNTTTPSSVPSAEIKATFQTPETYHKSSLTSFRKEASRHEATAIRSPCDNGHDQVQEKVLVMGVQVVDVISKREQSDISRSPTCEVSDYNLALDDLVTGQTLHTDGDILGGRDPADGLMDKGHDSDVDQNERGQDIVRKGDHASVKAKSIGKTRSSILSSMRRSCRTKPKAKLRRLNEDELSEDNPGGEDPGETLGVASLRSLRSAMAATKTADETSPSQTPGSKVCVGSERRKRGRPRKMNVMRVIWDPEAKDRNGTGTPTDSGAMCQSDVTLEDPNAAVNGACEGVSGSRDGEDRGGDAGAGADGGALVLPSLVGLRHCFKKDNTPVLCFVCGKVYDRQWKLELHMAKVHHDGVVRKERTCPVCPETFYTAHELKRHVGSCHDERVQCELCGKMVKKATLWEHNSYYHTEPRFLCSLCGFKATRWHHLQRHVESVHQKLRNHTCTYPECNSSFSCKSALQKHVEVRHEEIRRHECDWPGCRKAFGRRYHLNRHTLTHTGEKPIRCLLCEYSCRQKTSLDFHMRKKHAPSTEAPTDAAVATEAVTMVPEAVTMVPEAVTMVPEAICGSGVPASFPCDQVMGDRVVLKQPFDPMHVADVTSVYASC